MAMPTMTRAAKLKIENQRSRLNGLCTEETAPPVSLIVLVPDAELIAVPRRRTPVDRARSNQTTGLYTFPSWRGTPPDRRATREPRAAAPVGAWSEGAAVVCRLRLLRRKDVVRAMLGERRCHGDRARSHVEGDRRGDEGQRARAEHHSCNDL